MRKNKTIFTIIGCFLAISLLVGCQSKDESVQPATDEVTLQSIAVDESAKRVYEFGENFVKAKITASYSDKTTKVVTDSCVFSGYSATTPGKQNISVSYTEKKVTKETSYQITVNKKQVMLVKIEIDSENAKTEYSYGEEFVKPTVTATFDDESTVDVSNDATFSGYDSETLGQQEITVSYTNGGVTKTTSYNVSVAAVMVNEINVYASAQLSETRSMELTVEVLPENATNKQYELSVEDPKVLDLQGNVVTGLSIGTTKVVATALDGSEVKGELEITVHQRGELRDANNVSDILLSKEFGREGKLVIDYKYVDVSADANNAFSVYLGVTNEEVAGTAEHVVQSFGNFKFYHNKMNDNGVPNDGVTFEFLRDGYNRVTFDLATIAKATNGATGTETFNAVMFRWIGATQGIYIDVEPVAEIEAFRGVVRSSSNQNEILLSKQYSREGTLAIDYMYIDSSEKGTAFSLYLGESISESFGNFKFYGDHMNDNGVPNDGVTITELEDGYMHVVFDLATIDKTANGANGTETFSKVMFKWFGPTQGVYIDVEPSA